MGGGDRFPYPKFVWTPTGGWWHQKPKNWKRNTFFTIAIGLLGAVPIFLYSASQERTNIPARPIPSQRWRAHALEDDPDYLTKREEYKKNVKPLLERILPNEHDH